MIVLFLVLYVIIEIIQTWFIVFEKRIAKGLKIIILTEIVELPLELYLILQGDPLIILLVIAVMVLQGLAIAILFSFSR